MWPKPTPASVFRDRRARLSRALGPLCALIAAGQRRSKNFPANVHPFRADSHFLYLVGRSIPGAAILLGPDGPELFVPPASPDDVIWLGPTESNKDLEAALAIDVRPLPQLADRLRDVLDTRAEIATVSPNEEATAAWLTEVLGRDVRARAGAPSTDGTPDALLADALIAQRLIHDEAAIEQLRQAAAATAAAHRAGMQATRPGLYEAQVNAAMMAAITAAGMTISYEPIVTAHGEVLHNERHDNLIGASDLVLADVGAETPEGFAGDVTRVWPANGHFSATQRALYELVLDTQKHAISLVAPGTRYRAIHEAAARRMLQGLVDLGIFRGSVDGLAERGAHALFFPHGVGHLLGIDVHDMEDFGDRAGYAPGRARPVRFGDCYLRLDRDLAPGMAVTIEPGFYRIPALLADDELTGPFDGDLDRAVLAKFADVRGIRIEDDVLVTENGSEVLTSAIPKESSAVEEVVRSRAS
ncbi:MAG TPA: Xaa-Pro aminopeptidase [Polyangiaceae bacterium]